MNFRPGFRRRYTPEKLQMRMEKPLHPFGGRALGEVLFRELVHGRDERRNRRNRAEA